jgi:hypothetical protein
MSKMNTMSTSRFASESAESGVSESPMNATSTGVTNAVKASAKTAMTSHRISCGLFGKITRLSNCDATRARIASTSANSSSFDMDFLSRFAEVSAAFDVGSSFMSSAESDGDQTMSMEF